jgi:hypothetical protein
MPFPCHTVPLKADKHIACCAHAVPLPCRAAKGRFTHIMPCTCHAVPLKADPHIPCRAHAVPLPCLSINSHMPCRALAMLRQCRVLRESPRGSRKYPNCYSNSLTDRLFCSVLLPLFTVVGMDRCEEDWYASDNNFRGTPRGSRKKPKADR